MFKVSGFILISLLILTSTFSCKETYTPKPPGYIKVEYPEKKYRLYNSNPPFKFEYPEYAEIIPDTSTRTKETWLNLTFPSLNGTIYLSYKKLDNNLNSYIEDCRKLAYKHSIKAESIDEILIQNSKENIYGIFYDIKGNTASSIQFFVTDSVSHFLRGSLYFHAEPNQDSLSPIISFVRKDIDHLLETLRWK